MTNANFGLIISSLSLAVFGALFIFAISGLLSGRIALIILLITMFSVMISKTIIDFDN